jgi:transcriptional regulator with XRE-family HTH domain
VNEHRAIRAELAKQGLRAWQLAKRLRIAPSTLSDYLRGARQPPGDFLVRIAEALDIPVAALSPRTTGKGRR